MQSLLKGLRILEAFTPGSDEMTLKDNTEGRVFDWRIADCQLAAPVLDIGGPAIGSVGIV